MATFTHTITLHCFVVARPFALLSLVFCPFSAVFTFVSLVSIYARYDITIDRDTTQCRPTRLNGFLAARHAEVGDQTWAVKVVSPHPPPPPTTMTFEALVSRRTLPLACTWPACGMQCVTCTPHAGHVHVKGKVHRDIKASNVIVVGGGGCEETTLTAKVWNADFGMTCGEKTIVKTLR